MKRIISLAFLFIIANAHHSIMAQEIKVVSLMEFPSDSMVVSNPVYDINGNLCAVLKVYSSLSELTFSGMIVGNVVADNSNCYLLHIPSKTKRIKYHHPEFLPGVIDFTEFQLSVEGGKVYSATLKENSAEPPSSNTIQYLTFKSKFPLKSIFVNGEEWSCKEYLNTYIAKKLVPLGHYNYVARTEDGRVWTGTVEVKNTKVNKTVTIE